MDISYGNKKIVRVMQNGEQVRPKPLTPGIDPNQDYDMVQTLTFENPSGTCNIRLYRESSSTIFGTVYYRAGTSGDWTAKSVSSTSSTFPVSSTTMQVAHDWNKSGNDYMTCSFYGQSTNLKAINISLKAVLSGVMGKFFMAYYANNCAALTSLSVPDTSGLTSVGDFFMYAYARGCTALTSLSVPDTSGLTSVGDYFMNYYARGCTALTSLSVPDTSGLTTVGNYFMYAYANNCTALTSLSVPDTSGLTSVGDYFMNYYANNCTALASLSVPDTSGLTTVGDDFMVNYAYNCASLTSLILPKVGWFETNNVNWDVPSGRLGALKGKVIDAGDLADRQGLTTNGKTLYTNYIRDPNNVELLLDPNQDYDMVQTLTFENPSGTCNIRLYRGSSSAFSGTVYYRAGTSGDWTAKSVSGTYSTFPVSSTTMQVAHDWNKSGNDYMTCSFYGQSTNLKAINISLKAVLSGVMGNFFMAYYANNCTALTSLSVPDTSGLTSVGDYFMYYYARGCTSLTSLSVPDTSGLTTVGNYFMHVYAYSCTALTSLSVPDTSVLTTVGDSFMYAYARGCTSLASLSVPDTSGLTSVGSNFMANYARGCTSLTSLSVPDTSGLTSVGSDFMYYYANNCTSLTSLILPKVGWFETNNVNWDVPSGRLGVLKGKVIDAGDLADRQGLTTSGKTLYTNYIQDPNNVELL